MALLRRCRWAGLAVVLLLVGCNEQELYSRLSEQEANDMVALLISADLPATKQREKDNRFTVMTSGKAFANAVSVLHANGFPRQNYDTLGEVFAKEGFVSSPLEERARLNHALSQEIAHTISSIDGVVMARVHLAVPERDNLSDTVSSASASVFVKHRPDVDLTDSIGQIKALVVNGIENLPYEQVTVALFKADQSGWPGKSTNVLTPVASSGGETQLGLMPALGPSVIVITAAFIGSLVAAGFWWRSRRLQRQPVRVEESERSLL